MTATPVLWEDTRMARFPFRYDPVSKVILTGTGFGGGYAEIDEGQLKVRMGIGFSFAAPLAAVTGAERLENEPRARKILAGVGVHGFGKRWRANGAVSPIVRVSFGETQRARLLGVPLKVDVLDINPADTDEFLLAVGHPNG
jgi:hypothetical protein